MKKTVFAFLLGVVLTGSIAGVVALNYNAKDVSYTPSDTNWNVNNVEDAIKDLKSSGGSISKNMTIEELQAYSVSAAPTSVTISNVSNYRYYYISAITWYCSKSYFSDKANDLKINSITNASYLKLGASRSRYQTSQSGTTSGFLIFPDGSNNDININIDIADGLSVYGIK